MLGFTPWVFKFFFFLLYTTVVLILLMLTMKDSFFFLCLGSFIFVFFDRLKSSFVYRLWSWNRIYLGNEVTSLIGFLAVDSLHLRAGKFFVFSFSVLGCGGLIRILHVYFWIFVNILRLFMKKSTFFYRQTEN